MSIAFFDLDKTLIAENSAKLWLKDQWNNRQIKLSLMLQASYWIAKYHLGYTRLDEVIKKGLLFIEGEKQSFILKNVEEFYHSTVKNLYRPGAILAIKKHK